MSRVDLHIEAGKLAGTFDQMRSWLDHHDCVPVLLKPIAHQTGTIHLHVQFNEDRLADAFRQEFGDADRGPPAGKMASEGSP